MATNPFENVTFGGGETPTISNDDITRVLVGMNPMSLSEADTKGGVERVNQNSAQTGTVAYRDDKGQAVLTNVAKDSTGAEKPIAALFRPPVDSATNPSYVTGTGEARPSLFNAYKQLQAAKTVEEAEAIYSSLLESIGTEATRLEKEAYTFAENKFGLPEMQKQINEARQADRADPLWAPGMGDSPITQKLMQDFRLLSDTASNDARSYLKRNMTYNSIATLKGNAEREYSRIQTQASRMAQRADQNDAIRTQAETNRIAQQQIRREDAQWRREQEAEQIYNQLTATQIENIMLLNAGEMSLIENEQQRRTKIADLAKGSSKDKKMSEAITAESDQQLVGMAINGNGAARKLVVMKESMRTGKSTQEIEETLRTMSLRMTDQRLATDVLNRQVGMSSQERGEKLALLNPAMFNLDPNKKAQANALRVELALADMQYQVQQRYLNDVSSWGSTEPTLLEAIDRAKKTTGKADIKSVVGAFVGDALAEERKARVDEFNKLMKNAALKHKDSLFGAPNWREAEKIATTSIVNLGIFSGVLQKLHNMGGMSKSGVEEVAGTGRAGMLPAMVEWGGKGVESLFPMRGDK